MVQAYSFSFNWWLIEPKRLPDENTLTLVISKLDRMIAILTASSN